MSISGVERGASGRSDMVRILAAGFAAAVSLGLAWPAAAAEPIRIGDMNSYTSLPAFSVPYRMGWQLAVDEINAAGGVLGRELEVVSRDDGGRSEEHTSELQALMRISSAVFC